MGSDSRPEGWLDDGFLGDLDVSLYVSEVVEVCCEVLGFEESDSGYVDKGCDVAATLETVCEVRNPEGPKDRGGKLEVVG